MIDPTIFDNLKVIAEGAVYDLDLMGTVSVTDRVDSVDLASMSRTYSISFCQNDAGHDSIVAELRLKAGVKDLSEEILERQKYSSGCILEVLFNTQLKKIDEDCGKIENQLKEIWGKRPQILQKVSFVYGEEDRTYQNEITLQFDRKINEAQADDIPVIVSHMLQSFSALK
jgi:hypothetical protein